MCKMIMAILIGLTILILIGIVLAIIALVNSHRHRKRLEDIMLYQINVGSTIDGSIPQILDLIIQESFRDYQIKYLALLEEGYINAEREAEIRKELVVLVTNRISSAALDKLSLFYNIANIADILADKIYIIVMNYVAEHNKPYIAEE